MMKKYSLVLVFILYLSACASSPKLVDLDDHFGILVLLQFENPNDSELTDNGFEFQTVSELLGFELQTFPCDASRLEYGMLQHNQAGDICFPISFKGSEDYSQINPLMIQHFLAIAAQPLQPGDTTDDPNIPYAISFGIIHTDYINNRGYWGTVMLNNQADTKLMVGIPNDYFGEDTVLFALYPLTGEEAELLIPFVALD